MPWSLDLDSAKRVWERGRDELGHAGAWLKSEGKDALQGGKELAQGLRDAVTQVATPEQAVAVAAKLADKLEEPVAALTEKGRHAADGARHDVTRLVATVKDHAAQGGVKRLAADALAARAQVVAGVGDVVGPAVSPMAEQSIAVGKALDGDWEGAKLHASVALGAVVHAAMPVEASGIDAYARARHEGKAGVGDGLKAAGSSLLAQLAAANPGFTATAAEMEGLRAGRSVLADGDPRGAGQHLTKAALHIAATVAAIVGADEVTAATAAASDLERGAATRALSLEPNAHGKIEALEHVNRGYPGEGRTENCLNVVIATDATIGGSPASALPGKLSEPSVLEKTYGREFVSVGSKEQIEMELRRLGPGSRAIIAGQFENAPQRSHVFNAINSGGTVYFVDGQSAEPVSFWGYAALWMLRTK